MLKYIYVNIYAVAFARIFFPSEAKLVMRIAQADSTEEFVGITNFSKLKEVDLNPRDWFTVPIQLARPQPG